MQGRAHGARMTTGVLVAPGRITPLYPRTASSRCSAGASTQLGRGSHALPRGPARPLEILAGDEPGSRSRAPRRLGVPQRHRRGRHRRLHPSGLVRRAQAEARSRRARPLSPARRHLARDRTHASAAEPRLAPAPPMNWRVSFLARYRLTSNSDAHSPGKLGREATTFDCERDYFAIKHALETGHGYVGTVEFFPDEGNITSTAIAN